MHWHPQLVRLVGELSPSYARWKTGSAMAVGDYRMAPPTRGRWAQFYDPDGERFGIPTFPYHFAPMGLVTRRQLRAQGLRPAGQTIKAQILWWHRKERRVAYLYDISLAKPKREPTPAQLAAVGKALAARKTCPSCGEEKEFCIPRSLGECWQCADEARRQDRQIEDYEAEAC
jgi:hypothetical protein